MRILIASSIYQDAIDKLSENHDVICAFNGSENVLKSKIKDCEVLIFRSGVNISAEVMKGSHKLKLLVRAGSGIDNLDLEYVRQHNIKLFRIPEPGAKAVAEMSFGLMIALARNILQADHLLREGHWAKREMVGYLLTEKVLGVVGAGNIGSRVGRMGAAWGMKVLGCVEEPAPPGTAEDLARKGIQLVDFDRVIREADYISIHVPKSESTRNLINTEVLSRVKPGAFLVNLSRGGVVEEKAVYDALTNGNRLRGAALDVHENEGEGKISPLAELPNVILTPHIGAQTYDSQREIGQKVLQIIDSSTY